jgi:glutamine cyclotransferase
MMIERPTFGFVFALFLSLASGADCADRPPAAPIRLAYKVVATLAHDITASTQGLLFHEGAFYESTGGNGESTLRKSDPATGRVEGTLHLGGLQRPRPRDPDAVLNGIAYDPGSGLLYVTGKRWPKVHAIRLRED